MLGRQKSTKIKLSNLCHFDILFSFPGAPPRTFGLGGVAVCCSSIALVSPVSVWYPKFSLLVGFRPLVLRHGPDTLDIFLNYKKI